MFVRSFSRLDLPLSAAVLLFSNHVVQLEAAAAAPRRSARSVFDRPRTVSFTKVEGIAKPAFGHLCSILWTVAI